MSDKKIINNSAQPTSTNTRSAELTSRYNSGNVGSSAQPSSYGTSNTGSNNTRPSSGNKK